MLVFPWILWGLLFGWNLLSPVICNIVLLTITMFVFVWLVKPTWKQLGILTVLFSLYSLFVRYMLSGMPEVICFSLLILFYGLAMSYLKKESRGKLIAMFVISVLLTLMRPYMLLFLALACYFWICRNKKAGWIGSILIVAATGITYALIKHYLGAEYFTPLFYTDWITTFFTDGIGAGFRNLFGTLYWKGLEFYRHCIEGGRNGLASGAFFDGYLLVLLILLVQSFLDIRTLRRAKRVERIAMEPEDKNVREALFGPYTLTEDRKRELHNQLVIEVHFALSLIAMLFAHLLMYKMVEGSKHFLTFIAAGIFIVSMLETRYYKKAVLLGAAFLYLYSFKAVEPYDYQIPYVTEERQAQVEYWREIFSEKLAMDTEQVPNYENVVIWTFGDETPEGHQNLKWQLLYSAPKGFGISCCEREYITEHLTELQSRYLATLYSVMDYCKEWFSAVETPIGIVVLLGMALCLVLSYGAVDWVRQNHNIAPAIAFGTFALTVIVGGVISATVNNCFMGRYAFPGMGFVMLWYAVGFAQITENTKGKSRKIWAAGLLGTAGLCFLLQYTSEIRLEYDDGLETYENFVEEYMTENDAIIGPYTHTIFLNVYHPELHYYTIAYKLYSLPFVNTEALSSYSQLDTYDNLWYICFQGGYPNEMEDEYSYEQVLEFHYMYYDFAIFRLEKLEEE